VEAVFPPEICWIFSGGFESISDAFQQELVGNHRKNPKNFRWEYCFHVPVISDAFLPEPARNFRPGLFLFFSAFIASVGDINAAIEWLQSHEHE